ncbi:acyl-CoA dehydrogenase family protein [Streptosporangium sp. NPDC005286]|uniref:acyl-CoA dehydrogenase family protein n=1 Tax=Streptosporangium sp. NPDC005286 TaxID=3154463 RepID=UPI0033BC1D1B
MDFRLDETAETLSGLTGGLLARGLPDERIASAEFEAAGYSEEAWHSLAGAGVLEAFLPEDLGGTDADAVVLAAVLRQAARYGGMVPALPVLAYGLHTLARYGGTGHRDLLGSVAKGGALVTGAVRGPGGGRALDTDVTAEPYDGGHRLTGVRTYVPFGAQAEAILVPARITSGPEDGTVGVFVVDAAAPGLAVAAHPVTDHVPTARIALDAVAVPGHALLGGPALAAEAAGHLELSALLGVAATASGLLERAMELTAEHVKARKQFGRALAQFQAVTMQMGDVFTAQRILENTYLAAAWQLAAGRTAEARRSLSSACYLVCHDAVPALLTCQHLHGGTGLDIDHPLHRYVTGGLALGQFLGGTEACLDAAAGSVRVS